MFKIHACIDCILKQDTEEPLNIEEIDIDKFFVDLDPDIWKALCLLTQPLSSHDLAKVC